MENPSPTPPEHQKPTGTQSENGDKNPFFRYVDALGTFRGGLTEINAFVADLRDEAATDNDQTP